MTTQQKKGLSPQLKKLLASATILSGLLLAGLQESQQVEAATDSSQAVQTKTVATKNTQEQVAEHGQPQVANDQAVINQKTLTSTSDSMADTLAQAKAATNQAAADNQLQPVVSEPTAINKDEQGSQNSPWVFPTVDWQRQTKGHLVIEDGTHNNADNKVVVTTDSDAVNADQQDWIVSGINQIKAKHEDETLYQLQLTLYGPGGAKILVPKAELVANPNVTCTANGNYLIKTPNGDLTAFAALVPNLFGKGFFVEYSNALIRTFFANNVDQQLANLKAGEVQIQFATEAGNDAKIYFKKRVAATSTWEKTTAQITAQVADFVAQGHLLTGVDVLMKKGQEKIYVGYLTTLTPAQIYELVYGAPSYVTLGLKLPDLVLGGNAAIIRFYFDVFNEVPADVTVKDRPIEQEAAVVSISSSVQAVSKDIDNLTTDKVSDGTVVATTVDQSLFTKITATMHNLANIIMQPIKNIFSWLGK